MNTQRALTHCSHGPDNYERLEFLGDSVLGMLVTEWLLARYPDESEGNLSKLKATIVSKAWLYQCGITMGIHLAIRVGNGQLVNASIVADCMESTIGALYLDSGLQAARDWVSSNILSMFNGVSTDARTVLEEYCTKYRLLPKWNVKCAGLQHDLTYTAVLSLGSKQYTGQGRSIKAAQNNAAQRYLHGMSVTK